MIFLGLHYFSPKQYLECFITSDSERKAGIALTGRVSTVIKIVALPNAPAIYQNKTTATG